MNSQSGTAWRESLRFRSYSLDKQEAECACMALYVNALIQTENPLIRWPLSILKDESPDFTLTLAGQTVIGVEHTTVTSTEYQQFRAQSLKHPVEETVWLDRFKLGGAPTSEVNSGWVGNEVEREWATLAFQSVAEKLGKLNRPHFKKHTRNELLLNTISYLPNVELEVAIPMLAAKLTVEVADGKHQSVFDAISFIYGRRTLPHGLVKKGE
jgi:hypothetical protein